MRTKTTLERSRATVPSSVSRSCQPSERSTCLRSFENSLSLMRTLITWPPPKPISTRFVSLAMAPGYPPAASVAGRRLDDLREHAAGRLRVQERDAASADPRPRLGVDERDPALLQARERGVDVGDTVGDVVEAGPALLDELADGRVRSQGAQQLDVAVADVEEHGLDPLRLDRLAVD